VVATGYLKDRTQAGPRSPRTNPRQSLVHQDPVVGVQRHHVGDAAQRHQVQQFGQVRLGPAVTGEPAQLA